MWEEVEAPRARRTATAARARKTRIDNLGKSKALFWSRTVKERLNLICPKCGAHYHVIVAKGVYFSVASICPVCHHAWKIRYWKTIVGFTVFLVLLYVLSIGLFLHAIGLF